MQDLGGQVLYFGEAKLFALVQVGAAGQGEGEEDGGSGTATAKGRSLGAFSSNPRGAHLASRPKRVR